MNPVGFWSVPSNSTWMLKLSPIGISGVEGMSVLLATIAAKAALPTINVNGKPFVPRSALSAFCFNSLPCLVSRYACTVLVRASVLPLLFSAGLP